MTRSMTTCCQALPLSPLPRGSAMLPISGDFLEGAPRACLTAIQGGRMELWNEMFGVPVWHRLRHHDSLAWPPSVQMQCNSCC